MVTIWGKIKGSQLDPKDNTLLKIVIIHVIYTVAVYICIPYTPYTNIYKQFQKIQLQKNSRIPIETVRANSFPSKNWGWPFLHETVLPCQAVLSSIKLLEAKQRFVWEIHGGDGSCGDPPAAPKTVRVDHGASQPSWRRWQLAASRKKCRQILGILQIIGKIPLIWYP